MTRVNPYNETEEINSWGTEGYNTLDLSTAPKILNQNRKVVSQTYNYWGSDHD